jgi:hypothetical protein
MTIISTNINRPTNYILGIYFDEHLSIYNHIDKFKCKLNKSLFCINQAKYSLNKKSLMTLYYAHIHSHQTYCLVIVALPPQISTKLEKPTIGY